jgi:hypothetical protein
MISPVFILVTLAVGLSGQRTLELGMLQDALASPSRHKIDACLDELHDHRRIAILPIETN